MRLTPFRAFAAFTLGCGLAVYAHADQSASSSNQWGNSSYHVKLSVKEMRIDHMASHTRCPMTRRNCTLSLSYTQPIGEDLFSSQFDVPILSSDHITSTWQMASVGDYVVHLANTPLDGSLLGFIASARF